jgi:hypothetical protein
MNGSCQYFAVVALFLAIIQSTSAKEEQLARVKEFLSLSWNNVSSPNIG